MGARMVHRVVRVDPPLRAVPGGRPPAWEGQRARSFLIFLRSGAATPIRPARRRVTFDGFFSSFAPRALCLCVSFPDPVTRIRFRAVLLVFIFGIVGPLVDRRGHTAQATWYAIRPGR